MARSAFHKVIIGRSDVVRFVDLAIADVPAKVDTGAYGSAVHASNIKLSKDGATLKFDLFGGHPTYDALSTPIKTKQFKEVEIKNSFGALEKRFEVRLKVKIGPKVFFAYFNLADRSKMMFPILLGRKMLNNRFLVDSSHSHINRRELKTKYSITVPMDEEKRESKGLL